MDNNSIILTHLVVSKFEPYRRDRAATETTTSYYKAETGSARVNKRLYPTWAMKNVDATIRFARERHRTLTAPWFDDGTRALPATLYLNYVNEMNDCKAKFWTAVEEFLKQEPTYRAQDATRLAGLFNEDDYPPHDELRSRFNMDIALSVVPNADDFRFNMSPEEEEKIKTQITEQMQKVHENWANDLATRLYKIISRFNKQLQDPEGIFKNRSLSNLTEMANILKDLNMMDDPNIETLADAVLENVTSHEPDDLRVDKAKRATVAKETQRITDQLSALYQIPTT